MTSYGRKKSNESVEAQVKYAKKIGLKLSSMHSDYDEKELHYFWEEGKFGDKICNYLIKQVKCAKRNKFKCLVIHTDCELNEIGLVRFRKILKVCNKLSLLLAIENIDNYETFEYIFNNIKDPMLKICYDSGHENFSVKQHKFLEKYIDDVICVH